MLSEKTVFENLVDTYILYDVFQTNWADPNDNIFRSIYSAIDSKTNNMILIRGIYKRDASIGSCLSWELYISQAKNFLDECRELCISSDIILAYATKKLWSSQWIKKDFSEGTDLQIESNGDYIVV